MKKSISLILLFLISLSILFLHSCSRPPKFENDERGNLIDSENDRLYLYCGSYLRAAEFNPAPYARYDADNKTLHEIPGVDPAEWLTENIQKLGMPLLFRESSVEEPDFAAFGTERIHIVVSAESNARIGLIDDAEQIQSIKNDYLYGDDTAAPLSVDYDLLFYFESPDYPGIYYVINYLTGADGREYLFERWTKRCVLMTPIE